jgi:hypothetical protein
MPANAVRRKPTCASRPDDLVDQALVPAGFFHTRMFWQCAFE